MHKTNEELDTLIAAQEDLLAEDAGRVDQRRGHVTRSDGQLVRNRIDAIRALESRRGLATVTLRAGV